MRVITGVAKGRRLFSVPSRDTRPITDRVKEALFDILAERVTDSRFADLFAGTGGVGIEALSRGARHATFVDSQRQAIHTIHRNLEVTGLSESARVLQRDAFKFIAGYEGEPFDIVYVAPPQYRDLWARMLKALDGSPALAPGGLVVVQIHPKEFKPLELPQLVLCDQRKYGSTLLCFYEARKLDRTF